MGKRNKKGKNDSDSSGKYTRNLRREILDHFIFNSNKNYTPNQVADAIRVKDRAVVGLIREILRDEVAKGNLLRLEQGRYQYTRPEKSFLEGRIEITQNGRGFVILDNMDEDIPIPKGELGTALHGDIVKISINPKAKKLKGFVESVVERKRTRFVGIIQQSKNFAFFLPTNSKIHIDFFIPNKSLHGAKNGDKVIVELLDWTNPNEKPEAKVVDVLGKPGDNDVEMHAIMVEYDLPYEFPDHIEAEADKIPKEITTEEIKKRKDMRKVTTFTIDPYDAKDFDDALSLRELENGNIEIGVHIADVSHYLQPGTVLDEEAITRATSVYLVDRTVPMLPEILSNELCSLKPNEDKLCFSAVFELTSKAEVKKQWFGKTVIHSDRRFTYEEAQERIENKSGDFQKEINQLNDLARIMREARYSEGAIDFHSEEVRFNLDEKGKPISVYVKTMKESNQLIEEFMLLANKKVAEFVGGVKTGKPKTFIYRVHDLPDPEKLRSLREFVTKFGLKMDQPTQDNAARVLKDLMKEIRGTAEEMIIQPLAIRSMAKAVYTTENIGHFGLGFDYYSHFTSPIRRYPDVMVHRLLFEYLNGEKSADAEAYEQLCKHCSIQEKKAQDAEWASIKYKQVEFIGDQVGAQLTGVISGLTTWGMYIELVESRCEGMARLSDMKDDYYSFDERSYSVKGSRHGQEFHLGDTVDVIVKEADMVKRQLDFEVVV